MSSVAYISEAAALRILRQGEFTDSQARIVLMHSTRRAMFGGTYYPLAYISKHSRDHAAKHQEA